MPQGVRHGAPGDVVHGVPLEEGLPALPRLTEPRRSLLLAHFALEVPSRPPGRPPRTQGTAPRKLYAHTHTAPPPRSLSPPCLFFFPFENKLNPTIRPRSLPAGAGRGCLSPPHSGLGTPHGSDKLCLWPAGAWKRGCPFLPPHLLPGGSLSAQGRGGRLPPPHLPQGGFYSL